MLQLDHLETDDRLTGQTAGPAPRVQLTLPQLEGSVTDPILQCVQLRPQLWRK